VPALLVEAPGARLPARDEARGMSSEDVFAFNRTIARQERWIEERFGEEASTNANYGWYSDEHGVATKVYGHGVLSTVVDGPHVWFPLGATSAADGELFE
jgi:hypothetical protein